MFTPGAYSGIYCTYIKIQKSTYYIPFTVLHILRLKIDLNDLRYLLLYIRIFSLKGIT